MTQHISAADRDEARRLEIERALRLLIEPGQVAELRALNVPQKGWKPIIMAGYFDSDHLNEMAHEATRLTLGMATGVYVTLNSVNPDLLARAVNRVKVAKQDELTKDENILRRRWLLIDVDPVRVSGVSATDEEKAKARDVFNMVWCHLFDCRWPDGLVVDSGNGFHLLFRIDLPVGDDGLVKRVLQSLAAQFDTDEAKVDASVFNPSRISKLPGTMARKGDHVAGVRPWRWSRIESELPLESPLEVVSRELLEAVAAQATPRVSNVLAASKPTALLPSSPADRLSIPERARRYLTTLPPAVSGQGGSNVTFHAACVLVKGFALSVDAALPLLAEWNATCQPPWTEQELLHKLNDAVKAPGEVGNLLRASAQSPTGSPVAVTSPIGQRSALILPTGTLVRCGDRGNIGDVVQDDGGNTVRIHFCSPDGVEAIKDIPRREVSQADGTPLVPTGFTLNLITSREFATADYRKRFLIRHVLTEGQPCIVGGPRKGMKTGTMIELAVSLGSATPFLGREEFAVKDAVNVAIFSGESGLATLQETARRVAFAHSVELADCRIWWETRLPKIANPEHLEALRAVIRKHEIRVAILDPAYLCLLSGDTQGRQASNVFDMGSILQGLADVGQDIGCGIILAHHTRKNLTERFAVPDLDELAFAGFGEFARQWILLNRRKEYEPGQHELWLSIGGSAGHSSCWSLTIEEGIPDEEFRGRFWRTTVRPATEAIQQARDDREHQKENDRHSRMLSDLERIADLLRKATEPMTQNEIKTRLGLNDTNFKPAFAEALNRDLLTTTTKKSGNGRKYDAFKFRHSDTQTSV